MTKFLLVVLIALSLIPFGVAAESLAGTYHIDQFPPSYSYEPPPPPKRTPNQWQHPLLNQVASAFASRRVYVKCRPSFDDSILFGAYGYVFIPVGKQNYTVLESQICAGALAIKSDTPDAPDYLKARGAAVLVHESYHLKHVKGAGNESETECRAMQHYDIGLIKLGASPATVDRLMPKMLLFHFALTTMHEDYYRQCYLPDRFWSWIEQPNTYMR